MSLRGRETGFRLWAPTAWEAQVVLYPGGEEAADRYLPMKRGLRGLRELTVPENLDGWCYTYRIRIGSQWDEAPDSYAKAVGINGERSVTGGNGRAA
ncbi:1,4-alpha-glucan branching enzyme [Paenibacillus mucilaginosus]|uniref:hypothetical protein n=1 Tax=Paenibacillus mucilaginosus TaxID=61624 RepID=UPI003D1D8320